MPAIVYKITNRINGKVYIGMTSRTLEQRWKSHLSATRQGSKFRFHSAIRKYGIDIWTKEVLHVCEDLESARVVEERIIAAEMATKVGYNAKPGGCGGWIVPKEKFENWKVAISNAVKGDKNPNACAITNEQLLEVGIACSLELGHIPSIGKIRKYGAGINVRFPKHFTDYRFGGVGGYIKTLKDCTGMEHKPYFRDATERDRVSATLQGRNWYHNDLLERSAQLRAEDAGDNWELGRKKYD